MPNSLAMGFDFGTMRIGIAVGQTITATANPLTIVPARDGIPDWNVVGKLIEEWKPVILVVGLPLNMDGSDSEMSERAKKFARRLSGRFGVPSTTMDERLTTREAMEMSSDTAAVDGIAAKLILESYFRNRQ